MNKLFWGELKKIFLSPVIFIMTGVLIIALTVLPQFFTPINKTDSSTIALSNSSVESVYNDYVSNYKQVYTEKIDNQVSDIENLISNNTKAKDQLVALLEDVKTKNAEFRVTVIQGDYDVDSKLAALTQLRTSANNLWTAYQTLRDSCIVPLFFVDATTDANIEMFLPTNFIRTLEMEGNNLEVGYYTNLLGVLEENKFLDSISSEIDKIKNIDYSNENLQNLLNKVTTIQTERANLIDAEIVKLFEQSDVKEFNASEENINKIRALVVDYVSLCRNSLNVLEYSLKLELGNGKSDAEMCTYVGFEKYSNYEYNEILTKYTYLFDNNLSDSDFANVFAFNKSSNTQTNCYDYMYFALEIVVFVVIAFTVIIGAGMVAKEQSDGTMKLLAIRPYSRTKILFAKLLATLFFGFIFMTISFVVTLITGIIAYGTTTLPVLAIFNAKTPFVLSPIWLILIYLATNMIKIMVFVMLSFFISTIFKSYVAAVTSSIVIYLANLILTFISSGANWLKYNIFANVDLFKYLGGAFVNKYTEGEAFRNMFLSPVFGDTSILFSGIIIGAVTLVLGIISFLVFKHRDIT